MGKPYWKPTKEEQREVLDACKRVLAKRAFLGDMKAAIRRVFERHGREVSDKTIVRYLKRARAEVDRQHGKTPAIHRAETVAFHSSIVSDQGAPLRLRMEAQLYLDKLHGLTNDSLTIRRNPATPIVAIERVVIEQADGVALLDALRRGEPAASAMAAAASAAQDRTHAGDAEASDASEVQHMPEQQPTLAEAVPAETAPAVG